MEGRSDVNSGGRGFRVGVGMGLCPSPSLPPVTGPANRNHNYKFNTSLYLSERHFPMIFRFSIDRNYMLVLFHKRLSGLFLILPVGGEEIWQYTIVDVFRYCVDYNILLYFLGAVHKGCHAGGRGRKKCTVCDGEEEEERSLRDCCLSDHMCMKAVL